jgi:YD repeat-containing protein
MLRWTWLVLLFAGCSEDDCIRGVCPDRSDHHAYAGPCHSAEQDAYGHTECSFTYVQGHVTHVDCTWATDEQGIVVSDWTYDASWKMTSIHTVETDFSDEVGDREDRWTLSDQRVVNDNRTFVASSFAFFPAVGTEILWPQAELGLFTQGTTSFQWTTASPTTLHRSGTDGSFDVFHLDALGQVVSWTGPGNSELWTYDPSAPHRLIEHKTEADTIHYAYDAGGNVVEIGMADVSGDGAREVYDYTCW